MASDDAAAVVHRLLEEVYERGNLAVVDELVAMHFYAGSLKGVAARIHATLSAVACQIEETVVQDDRVAVRLSLAGTHTGEFRHPLGSAAATGNRVSITGILIARVAEGKVVAINQEWNMLVLLLQLGVLAIPAATD